MGETPYSTPKLRPSSHRTPSFSSSSHSDSWDSLEFTHLHSPIFPLKLMGIPFSWEQAPGIPKNHHGFKKSESSHRLPLPPAPTTKKWRSKEERSPKKNFTKRDPFFAALIECSKNGHGHGSNIWKGSLSDIFGIINMYTSCKNTCAVSEPIVYVPRAGPHYLLRRRSS